MSHLHLSEKQIATAIRKQWSRQGNVVLTGVRNGTGFDKKPRTADALSISTWPSRGLYAEGFEIKSSRSDLAREIANPAKADEIAQYCLLWWIATPTGLVNESIKLPESWGLVEVDEKLDAKIITRPKPLEPKPMDTLFVCSVLRNFAETHVPVAMVEELAAPKIEDARKAAKAEAGRRLKELEDGFARFKSITGISLTDERYGHLKWDLDGIASAINALQNLRRKESKELAEARKALVEAASALDVAEKLFSAEAIGTAERLGA